MLEDVAGKDTIELGCGTAYVSAWLARRGARPVGIDNSARQLETARRLQKEHGLDFPLIHGNGESAPFPDASFDLVISEYGVATWADPYAWIPEASRLLRPGGRLEFIANGHLMMLCSPELDSQPVGDRLLRDQFGLHRIDWPDDPSTEFVLAHGEWIRLLRANGFEIEDLIEIQAPEGTRSASTTWARSGPVAGLARRSGRPASAAELPGSRRGAAPVSPAVARWSRPSCSGSYRSSRPETGGH